MDARSARTVLVVDDSPIDRRLAGALLKKRGHEPVYAVNGREALAAMDQRRPDIVLTDLQMPELDGLELVAAIRSRHPSVPVILMTAHGSEEIAVKALHRGAASYVPKRNLAQELCDTVESTLAMALAASQQDKVLECLKQAESRFVIANDVEAIPPLVGYLEANLSRLKLCDDTARLQVAVALREALVNAIFHGNLEMMSDLFERDPKAYADLAARRAREPPYQGRKVEVTVRETRAEATYVVVDEGPGFNPDLLPDPMDPKNLEKTSGRGLLLIRTFMDEVHHNDQGNRITMVKRRDPTAYTMPPVGQQA
jgi:CheY-like chemotaxis protein